MPLPDLDALLGLNEQSFGRAGVAGPTPKVFDADQLSTSLGATR